MRCVVRKVGTECTAVEYVFAEKAFVGNVFAGRFGGHLCNVEVLEVL